MLNSLDDPLNWDLLFFYQISIYFDISVDIHFGYVILLANFYVGSFCNGSLLGNKDVELSPCTFF